MLANGHPVSIKPDRGSASGFRSALPSRYAADERAAFTRSQSRVAPAARLVERRPHGRLGDAHRASNGDSGPLTMGYYTRDDLPFYYALADAFTIATAITLADGTDESQPVLLA